MIGLGILFGLLFGFVDVGMHVVVFRDHDLLRQLSDPTSHELWDRLLILGLCIGFGVIAHYALRGYVRMEMGLRESERHWRNIFHASPDPTILMNAGGVFIDINHAAEQLIGTPRDQLIGTSLSDHSFLIGEDEHRAFARLAGIGKRAIEGPNRYRVHRKDGSRVVIESRTNPVVIGSRHFALITMADVTGRSKIEGALGQITEQMGAGTGEEFLQSLVMYLAEILEVDFAFVGELIPGHEDIIQTCAVCADGKISDNLTYHLKHTPCDRVTTRQPACYPSGVRQRFPNDQLLEKMDVEGYLGIPLTSTDGQALGVLVVMARRPITGADFALSVLRIFASRAAAELHRLKSERAMQESESTLRSTIESIGDMMFVLDDCGVFVDFHAPSGAKPYLSPDVFLGRSYRDLLPSTVVERISGAIERVTATGEPANIDYPLEDDGQERWYSARLSARSLSNGHAAGTTAIVRDITGLKQSEQALRESEARYRRLVDNVGEGIASVDPEERFTFANPAMEDLLGVARGTLVGRRFTDFVEESETDFVVDQTNRRRKGETGSYDVRIRRPDGEQRTLVVTGSPLHDASGEFIGTFGIMRDITDRIRGEEALRRSEGVLRSTLESTADGILVVDSDGKVTQANDRFAQMWRIPQELLASRDDERLLQFVIDQLVDPGAFLSKVQALYDSTDESLDHLLFKDGRTFERYSCPLIVDDQIAGRVWSFRDSTDRTEAERLSRLQRDLSGQLVTAEDDTSVLHLFFDACMQIDEVDCGGIYVPDPETGALHLVHHKGVSPRFLDAVSCLEPGNPIHALLLSGITTVIAMEDLDLPDKRPFYSEGLKSVSIVPVTHEGQSVACVSLASHTCEEIPTRSRDALEAMAAQLGPVIGRIRAESALKLTKFSVERAGDSIFWIEADGRIKDVNDATCRNLGYSPEELIGMAIHEIDPLHPVETWKASWDRLKKRKILTFESQHLTRDGQMIPVELTSNYLEFEGREYCCAFARDITERRASEEALQLTQLSIDRAGDPIYWIGPEGNFEYVNEAASKKLGYSPDELTKMSVVDIDPEATEETWPLLWESIRKERVVTLESVHRDCQGREFPVEITGNYVYRDGRESVFAFTRDITERKRTEIVQSALLNISEAASSSGTLQDLLKMIQVQLGRLIDTKNFYVALYDEATEFYSFPYICDEYDDYMGEAPPQSLARSLTDYVRRIGEPLLLPEEDHAKLIAAGEVDLVGTPSKIWMGVPLFNGDRAVGVMCVQCYDDEACYTDLDKELLSIVAGSVAMAIERKRAEENLRESRAKLAEAQRIAHVGNWELDIREGTLLGSDEFYRIFGLEPNHDSVPRTVIWERVHPDDLENLKSKVTEAIEKNAPYDNHFRVLRPDGTMREVHSQAHVVLDANGDPDRLFGTLQDVTERKQAEEEKRRLEAQLRRTQRLETIGTLAGGIAHDFNNILTPILGYADMALLSVPDGNVARSDLEHVIRAAQRAKELVQQILAFSRQGERERKPLEVHLVVKEALELLRASLPTTIEIKRNIDSNCGAVLADASQMLQVVMNLCTNAFHAMKQSGGTLEVGLATDHDYQPLQQGGSPGGWVCLTVSDSGHGMSKTTLERVFEPFFTTKGVGEGTGLGLSVVHGIVTDHGGEISVDSEEGVGTTFAIHLPRVGGCEASDPQQCAEIPGGSEHILLIDDETEITSMGRRLLESLGYRVTTENDSVRALQIYQENPQEFDIVICDHTMPNLTSSELVPELLALRPELPILLISGYVDSVTTETARRLGVREYMAKPLQARELGLAIRRLLDEDTKIQAD